MQAMEGVTGQAQEISTLILQAATLLGLHSDIKLHPEVTSNHHSRVVCAVIQHACAGHGGRDRACAGDVSPHPAGSCAAGAAGPQHAA